MKTEFAIWLVSYLIRRGRIFYSHKEIYETLKREKQWGETQIEERRDKIVRFIKENWLN